MSARQSHSSLSPCLCSFPFGSLVQCFPFSLSLFCFGVENEEDLRTQTCLVFVFRVAWANCDLGFRIEPGGVLCTWVCVNRIVEFTYQRTR